MIVDKNARIGDGARLVNEAGVEHADGDGYYIRNGIIIVPKDGVIAPGSGLTRYSCSRKYVGIGTGLGPAETHLLNSLGLGNSSGLVEQRRILHNDESRRLRSLDRIRTDRMLTRADRRAVLPRPVHRTPDSHTCRPLCLIRA